MLTVRSLFALLFLFAVLAGSAQSFSARTNVAINTHCNGFYEYLPAGYDLGAATQYPLLIAVHGLGERGNGNTELNKLIIPGKGLAALLNTGSFPGSFTVGGQTFRFIIICPQFTDNGDAWPAASDLESVINYAVANYRVDLTRIYLTGLSMGGGLSYRFATASASNAARIAAMVPICPALQPGPPYAARPDSLACRTITSANLPVWTTHNLGDNVVPVSFTDSLTHYINAAPSPAVIARKTIFTTYSDLHDAWTATYDPTFTNASGQNIYQWMLQYQRSLSVLPTALTSYRVKHAGAGALVEWASAAEDAGDRFLLERSADGTLFQPLTTMDLRPGGTYRFLDTQPFPGRSYYRLTLLRPDGQRKVFHILSFQTIREASLRLNGISGGSIAFTYSSNETGPVAASILDETGSVLVKMNYAKSGWELSRSLPVAQLGAGVYILRISGKNGQAAKRFTR